MEHTMPRLPSAGPLPAARFGGVVNFRQSTATEQAKADLGQAIAGLGDVIIKEKIKNDKYRIEDATNQLQQRMLDLMKGDNGWSHVQAGDVARDNKFYDQNIQKFQAARDEIGQSLTDETQKQMFTQRANTAEIGYKETLMNHITKETSKYHEQVYKGGIETEINSAAIHYDNPDEVKRSLLRVEKLTQAEADRLGIKGKARKALLDENKTNIHEQVIIQAVDDGNYRYAQEWFTNHQKDIVGTHQDDIKKLLRSSGIRQQSQEAVDKLVAEGLTETQAVAEARKLDPEIRDATIQRIHVRYKEAQNIRDREQDAAGAAKARWCPDGWQSCRSPH